MTSPRAESRITPDEFDRLIRSTIPKASDHGYLVGPFHAGQARITMKPDARNVRAGGAVSGPVLMALADTALYAAVLSQLGPEPMAVTSELSVRFVRAAPADQPLIADASILKMGRRQAVGEVRIAGADGKLCTHAIGTYTLPLK